MKHDVKKKLHRMWDLQRYLPPTPYDDLQEGIRLAKSWLFLSGTPDRDRYCDHLRMWIADATDLLGSVFVQTAPHLPAKLPPMHCVKCNHYNEYVGQEHLVGGVYTCRSCR